MDGTTTISISLIISVVTFLILLFTFFKDSKKEVQNTVAEDSEKSSAIKESIYKIDLTLQQVNNTVNETRLDIKNLNKDLRDIDKRVTVLERDVKTAFSRIDEMNAKKVVNQ